MGNNKKKKRKKFLQQKRDQTCAQASGQNLPKYSVDQLLNKVDEYIDTFQYDIAQKFCQRALEIDPDNTRVLETTGILFLELGEFDKAKQCFGRAITVSPEVGHSKYMYMGQLMTGPESIQYFMKGIELMKKHIEQKSDVQNGACSDACDSDDISGKDISAAYCSVAEIYLTDECFTADADDKCAECLANALEEDEENAEVHHLYASYWISKQETQKAKESIEKGLSLWLPKWREKCEETAENSQKNTKGDEEDLVESCSISYPARINVTKTLIELQDYDPASEICELLLDENDEIVETWYLLGWIHHLQGEDYKQNARFYLGKAQKLAKSSLCDDKDLVKHIDELLLELGGPVEDEPEECVENMEDSEKGELELNSDYDSDSENTNCQQMEH